jgi:hypothetical protein
VKNEKRKVKNILKKATYTEGSLFHFSFFVFHLKVFLEK